MSLRFSFCSLQSIMGIFPKGPRRAFEVDGPFLGHVTARKLCEGLEKANGLIFAVLCDISVS